MLDVNATDNDNDDLTYTMVRGTAGEALTYFYIYERTGAIILRRSLPSDYSRDFDFQVLVSDNGSPPKSFTANIKGSPFISTS